MGPLGPASESYKICGDGVKFGVVMALRLCDEICVICGPPSMGDVAMESVSICVICGGDARLSNEQRATRDEKRAASSIYHTYPLAISLLSCPARTCTTRIFLIVMGETLPNGMWTMRLPRRAA